MNTIYNLFSMGSGNSCVKKINYEDIQEFTKECILINTLSRSEQDCLIKIHYL